MNSEKENDEQKDNFSRLNEILISDFFSREELVEKLDTVKDKVNDWDASFFESEGVKALALMNRFLLRNDDGENTSHIDYLNLCDQLDESVPKNKSGEYNFENHPKEKVWFESAVKSQLSMDERRQRSIDLQWHFLTWLADYVYPVHYAYIVNPPTLPDD